MKFMKFTAGLCACVMALSFATLHRVYTKSYASNITKYSYEEPETRIYRTSIYNDVGTNNDVGAICTLCTNIVAFNSGKIHIDIQCIDSKRNMTIGSIGDIVFDDLMIASVGECAAYGRSSFTTRFNSKYTVSYTNNHTVYSVITPHSADSALGSTIMSFDLYVKEPYLDTDQSITIFGTEITIPFGDPPIDKDARIAELEAELERVSNTPSADIDNNGEINSVDAQYILTYFLYNTVLDTPTAWDEIIQNSD